MSLNWSHQENLFDPANARPTTVLGCGSVGSQVVLMLAKCGVTKITAYDADIISSTNLPMALGFRIQHLRKPKVEMIKEEALAIAGVKINAIQKMYEGEELKGSVICCVDTMEARMCAWKEARMNPHVDLFVDTRVARHQASVFSIRPHDPEDMAYYEKHLYPTSQTQRQTCGAHGVVYVTALAASMAVRALTGHWSGAIPRMHERLLYGDRGISHTYTEKEGVM